MASASTRVRRGTSCREVYDHFFALLGTARRSSLTSARSTPAYAVFSEPGRPARTRQPASPCRSVADGCARVFETLEPGAGRALDAYLDSAQRATDTGRASFSVQPVHARRGRWLTREVLAAAAHGHAACSRPWNGTSRAGSGTRFCGRCSATRRCSSAPAPRCPGAVPPDERPRPRRRRRVPDGRLLHDHGTHRDARARRGSDASCTGAEVRSASSPAVRGAGRPSRPRDGSTWRERRRRALPAGRHRGVRGRPPPHRDATARAPDRTLPRVLVGQARPSGPGAVLVMLGVRGELPQLPHHSLFFTRDWARQLRGDLRSPTRASPTRRRSTCASRVRPIPASRRPVTRTSSCWFRFPRT